MSAKDLNLSLQPRRARPPGPAHPAESGAPGATLHAVNTTAARRQKYTARQTQGVARSWVAPACIALANMTFLALAGIWLTGYNFNGYFGATQAPATTTAADAAELQALQIRLDSLGQQFDALQSTLQAQHQLLLTELSALDTANHDHPDRTSGGDQRPSAAPALPTARDWQVNLGIFANSDTALGLQRQMEELGYRPQAAQPDAPGDPVAVRIGGFGDRASAQAAALDIMTKTKLNGLWVGSSD